MQLEKYIETLETLIPNSSPDQATAVEAGCDALAFITAIHTALVSTGRVAESSSLDDLAGSIDALINELSAAAVFVAGLPGPVVEVLNKMADNYQAHEEDKAVAEAIAKAHRDFAKVVQGVKSAIEAKKVVDS